MINFNGKGLIGKTSLNLMGHISTTYNERMYMLAYIRHKR